MTKFKDSGIGRSLVALLAVLLLALEPALPAAAQETAPPKALQIVILDDETPLNNISERTAREPIVQVQDENHKPVAGALVLFAIHPGLGGAAAGFANGASTLTVTTNANGVARASGLIMNHTQGSWQLQVTASKDGLTTSTNINESNVLPENPTPASSTTPVKPPSHFFLSKPVTIIGGAIVVGVIVAIVVISKSNNPTSISAGGGTVGAPTAGGFKVHF